VNAFYNGIYYERAFPVVNQCSLSGNVSNYYVSGSGWDTTIILDAKNNSWGTDNVTEIAKTIFDYDDDPNLARVDITPVMTLLLPDLTVSNVQIPSEGYAGQSFKVSWTVSNVGNGAANGTWTDSVYISSESVFNPQTAKLLGSFQNMKSLALNETYTNSATLTLDSNTGTYYVFVVTDSGNNQAEISKDNNRSAASQVTIKTSPPSNLVAADLKVPSSASPSSNIDISWQVKNDGLWNISGQWVDSVYLRDKDNKDTLLGDFPRTEGVNANADYWLTKSVKIPTTVAPGSYSIVVKTNSNTGVNETNATDDSVVSKITIAKPKMMTATPDMIPLNLTTGVPATGQITIGNLGTADISGITYAVQNPSANISVKFDTLPSVIRSMETAVVRYTVTANDETVLKYKPIVAFKSGTDEAAVTFDITVIPRRPSLVVNPGYLETGILRGQQRIVRCEITNNGGAPANNLTVLMPQNVSWIKLVSPQNIGTLAVGAKAGIEISLNPPADISLQNPFYEVGIAVSDGANVGLIIGLKITITSDAKGGLKITAKDEESYFNKATQPNVKGATVIVTDMSGNKVAEGVTDATGIFLAPSINEGRYNLEVKADKHASFYSSVEIAPVVVKEVEAFMQMQLVTYRWSVVPVQIEDKYKVTIEAVFETHLPAPVVTVDPAFMLVPLDEGETTTVELKITNHGLIAANDVTINFPDNDEVYIKPLIEKIGVIDAMTTIVVPVKVRAKEDGPIDAPSTALRSSDNAREKRSDSDSSLTKCLPKATLQYSYLCGGTKVNTVYIDWSYLKKARAIIKKAIEARDKAIELVQAIQRLINIIEDLEDGSITKETADSIAALFGIKFIIDPTKNELVLDNSGDTSEFSGGGNIVDLPHFMITDNCLNILKSKGIPDDILLKLKSLKNIEYTGKYYFLNALESAIGKEQTEQYKILILESSKLVSNILLRGKRGWPDVISGGDAAVKLCEMLPGLCETAAQPGRWLCNYSPTACQNVITFNEKYRILESLRALLGIASDVISIGGDIILCASTVVNPLGIVGCASLACNLIPKYNDFLVPKITDLRKQCISEVPLHYLYPLSIPIPISVPLPECLHLDKVLPNISKIEKPSCFCGFVSIASFITAPSFASGVGGLEGLNELSKCMCGNGGGNYNPPPTIGGGGTFNPSFYNDNRAFTTKKPCWE